MEIAFSYDGFQVEKTVSANEVEDCRWFQDRHKYKKKTFGKVEKVWSFSASHQEATVKKMNKKIQVEGLEQNPQQVDPQVLKDEP